MGESFSFSHRTSWESSVNDITRLREKLQHSGIKIYDLTESNPTRCSFTTITTNLLTSFQKADNLIYAPDSRGLRGAREAISSYYRFLGAAIDPEQIFLTSSTSEGYSYLFRLLTDPGEGILLPRPSYPLFQFLADLNDVAVDFYPLVYSDRWHIDFFSLKELLNAQTKAVVLVNPNNPTGQYLTREENRQLQQLCQSRNVAVISDEVFYDYALAKPPHAVSLASETTGLNFTLGGVSKMFGLPQMKLSWIVVTGSDKKVIEACRRLEIIADTYLSVNTPVQHALGEWMAFRENIQGEIKTRLSRNIQILEKAVAPSTGVKALKTEGGWYAILELPQKCSEERLVTELLEKDYVFVHPGYFFDFIAGDAVILSLLPEEETFREGIRRLLARIAAC